MKPLVTVIAIKKLHLCFCNCCKLICISFIKLIEIHFFPILVTKINASRQGSTPSTPCTVNWLRHISWNFINKVVTQVHLEQHNIMKFVSKWSTNSKGFKVFNYYLHHACFMTNYILHMFVPNTLCHQKLLLSWYCSHGLNPSVSLEVDFVSPFSPFYGSIGFLKVP